ncbi:unnamed protein product [Caretta caretta]
MSPEEGAEAEALQGDGFRGARYKADAAARTRPRRPDPTRPRGAAGTQPPRPDRPTCRSQPATPSAATGARYRAEGETRRQINQPLDGD